MVQSRWSGWPSTVSKAQVMCGHNAVGVEWMNTTPRVAFRDAVTDIRYSSRARDVFPNVSLDRYAGRLARSRTVRPRECRCDTRHVSHILPQTHLPHQRVLVREMGRAGEGLGVRSADPGPHQLVADGLAVLVAPLPGLWGPGRTLSGALSTDVTAKLASILTTIIVPSGHIIRAR